ISTGSITTGSNSLLMRALRGDLIIRAGGAIQSTAVDDAVVLVAHDKLLNKSGSNALSVTGGGRWLVYAGNPNTSQEGNLEALRLYQHSYENDPPNTISDGNHFIYVNTLLPVTSNNVLTRPVPYLLNPMQSPNTV